MNCYHPLRTNKQIDENTCYITCMSNAIGIDVDVMQKECCGKTKKSKGYTLQEMKKCAKHYGWKLVTRSSGNKTIYENCIDLMQSDTLFRVIYVFEVGENEHHAVLWDGVSNTIIDPLFDAKKSISEYKKKYIFSNFIVPRNKKDLKNFEFEKTMFFKKLL